MNRARASTSSSRPTTSPAPGYEAAALAPLGPLDAQALLELDDPGARLSRLGHLLTDEARMLEFRLSSD